MDRWQTCWIALVLLRIFWTLLPQSGYIHPDEFFQNSEVVAGDVLNLRVRRTWEFNKTQPIRSMLFPYITTGIPLFALKSIQGLLNKYTVQLDVITTMNMVRASRIMTLFLSFLCDIMLYKIAKMLSLPAAKCIVLFASSYVTLIYYTHTFSNTIEAFLYTAFLYFVISSLKLREASKAKDKKENTEDDKAGEEKVNTIALSSIIVFGIFNRPTFIVFAIVPFLYWMCCDLLPWRRESIFKMLHRCWQCFPGVLYATMTVILFDSYYYGTFHGIPAKGILHVKMTDFTITPLNFLKYNLDAKNLAKHGIHPRWSHLVINLVLLFGTMDLTIKFCFFYDKMKSVFGSQSDEANAEKPDFASRITSVLFYCYFTPVVLLSFFPHQEPRFLIPLLVPAILVFLYRAQHWGHLLHFLLTSWFFWNTLGCILYGVLHQGGVIPAIGHLQGILANSGFSHTTHIVLYHTYMPPEHLFAIPAGNQRTLARSRIPNVVIHDLAGAKEDVLKGTINKIKFSIQNNAHHEVYVVAPWTLDYMFNVEKYDLVDSKSGHFSAEDFVDFEDFFCISPQFYKSRFCDNFSFIERLRMAFSLNIYQLIRNKK
ncbi:unnamed protein product [Owenia fusiformis]|uniref:Mannosyltransferase n=1 Tax=Owenia fusiformis TaxID=6347 RepID=A0A8J1TU75_OWEFU|nr:unnamed protein product [Owenia fusiformis]